jgi:hypothetical protein
LGEISNHLFAIVRKNLYNSSMTRFKSNKLNDVIIKMPPGTVLTLTWLKQHGVSSKLAWWYVQSHWLERIGNEAYKKYGDKVGWVGALSALQNQLHLPLHIGAKTALELLGQAHFIPMQGIKRVALFSSSNAKVPLWFRDPQQWGVECNIYQTSLFREDDPLLGIINKPIDGINVFLSSPERAALEVLHLVPNKQSFEEAFKLIETLSQLRPYLVQGLLDKCKSIKVKRLFLYLAEKFQHPWLSKVDLSKVNLGHGNRVIGEGGNYDSKYQLSLPKIVGE